MSNAGMHNYEGRKIGDHVVRSLAMGRDLERFVEDMGQEPLTPEQAYEAALSGGQRVIVRRQHFWGRNWPTYQWVLPAVGVDCLAAVNRGCADAGEIEANWREDFAADESHWMDSGWDDYGPKDCVHAAHAEVEWERSRQIWEAWELHERGFVGEQDMPVFLRRATPYEAALDLDRRIRVAELEIEIRQLDRINRALSCGL